VKTVHLIVSAELEWLEAVTWYEAKQEGVGFRFTQDVESLLAGLPSRQLRPLKGFERYGAKRVELGKPWPYRVIIVEDDSTLFVVALEHHRRRPGYWTGRLREVDRA